MIYTYFTAISGFGDAYITSIVLGIVFLVTMVIVVGCFIRCYKKKSR